MNFVRIKYVDAEIAIPSFDDARWQTAEPVFIEKYWSGSAAPAGRHATARLLWSRTSLYVRFDAVQAEPLVVSDQPDISRKTTGLWDRDVCEIFVAPDIADRNKYFEFEVAPTGEWVDLAIEITPEGRATDRDYSSKMAAASRVDTGYVIMAMKVPFAALGTTPKTGDTWLGNLFRCVGEGATRGYLAWQPTNTPTPNFHVPKAFCELRFIS
jgi:alpha-galactosidase